ncbi:Uncharacterised protein [uncultured archaeon]|nr:Uncharacterised protein [uncultured archaeon]
MTSLEKDYIAVIDKFVGKKAEKGDPASHDPLLVLYIPITMEEPDKKLNDIARSARFYEAVHKALADEGIKFYSLVAVYERVVISA